MEIKRRGFFGVVVGLLVSLFASAKAAVQREPKETYTLSWSDSKIPAIVIHDWGDELSVYCSGSCWGRKPVTGGFQTFASPPGTCRYGDIRLRKGGGSLVIDYVRIFRR